MEEAVKDGLIDRARGTSERCPCSASQLDELAEGSFAFQGPPIRVGSPYRNAQMGHDLTVARRPPRAWHPAWMKAGTCTRPLVPPSGSLTLMRVHPKTSISTLC